MSARPPVALIVAAMAICTIFAIDSRAYTTNGVRWTSTPVSYAINPANLDALSAGSVISSLQAGANSWALQSNAAIGFAFTGQSSQTANTNDGINLVLFRNSSSGSAIATTYSWYSGTTLLDTDIVFWDGAFTFYSGSTGCSGGFYLEDIAAHEFGHALGLGHSSVGNATMYPSTTSCNTSNRSLDADDLAGVLAIYGPRGTVPSAPGGVRIIGTGF